MNKLFLIILALLINLSIEAQISDFENVSFENADKIAFIYKGNDLKNLPELAYNLTNQLPTDVEKFRAIYTWVSTNIENDYTSYRKNFVKRKKFQNDSLKLDNWNKSFSVEIFKKLLKDKKTVCTGYAYLVKNLSNLANIKCNIIDGYGRTEGTLENETNFPNHSWNAVQINEKWYLCDATWSSGVFNLTNYSFEFDYNYGYFLANPEIFSKNHFPIDNNWFLLDKKPILSDFLKSPLLYGYAYTYNVFPIEPSTMFIESKKNKEIIFIIKDLKSNDINSIYLQIILGSSMQIIQPKVERLKDGLIKIKYTFSERGLHDVHITIKNQIICTYVVKVKP